ncbi:MAG: PhnD/SsuA/transferrin family substrate-binding protein [Oscillospiraceae bacterium]|nr:PhnD/SsuA/transferrin family substrate-binding protein [Oscillospiraceae bacterium]
MMNVLKKTALLLLCLGLIAAFAACGGTPETPAAPEPPAATDTPDAPETPDELVEIDLLRVAFVPSREPDEIIAATEPLGDLIIAEMAELGFAIGAVDITVGTTFEAVGEGLSAGSIDVGFIPGGTYVLFDDGAEVILAATRFGLSNDSPDPRDWNEAGETENTDEQVSFYRSIIVAGPSAIGQELAAIVNEGGELTWDDLNRATWGVMGVSSPAGYIYPALWLYDNFGQSIPHLDHVLPADSYATGFARLAAGQIDIIITFADARMGFAERWEDEFGRENSIWEDTQIIGVTTPIMNDTISVSRHSAIMTDALRNALQTAFINIGNSEAGREIIAIYNHFGYVVAHSSDYDSTRAAQALIRDLTS